MRGSSPNVTFQETGAEAVGPVKDNGWNFPSVTSAMFYWSEKPQGLLRFMELEK